MGFVHGQTIYNYIYIYIDRDSVTAGGEGGGGFWCSPPTDSPNPLEVTAGPWGSFMGSHRGIPPPPPCTMVVLRGGG